MKVSCGFAALVCNELHPCFFAKVLIAFFVAVPFSVQVISLQLVAPGKNQNALGFRNVTN